MAEASVFAILSLGFALGLKHATDADHVAAVTTFVSQERSLVRSCWIGAFWGAGHTLALATAGIAVILLKLRITSWLETRLELAVAAMLVLLGGRALYRTWAEDLKLHRHPHTHSAETGPHAHWHVHSPAKLHEHSGWLHVGLRPLLVGMVHGAAGSGALMLLVLSTIHSPIQALLYIVIFGAGSVAGMMAISLLLALPMQWASTYRPIRVAAGLFSCVFGFYLMISQV